MTDATTPARLHRFELLARRWTPGMIRDLLGSPDANVPHPRLPRADPIGAYDVDRVESIEASDAFENARTKANRSSAAMRESLMRRTHPKSFTVVRQTGSEVVDGEVAVVAVERIAIAALAQESGSTTEDEARMVDHLISHRVRCSAAVNAPSYGARRRKSAIVKEVARVYPELIDECSARLRRMGEPGL